VGGAPQRGAERAAIWGETLTPRAKSYWTPEGIVDADRMCLYGFSSGSGVVNYLVTRTGRFKCAVSVAPALSDWIRRALFETNASWVSDWAGVSLWDDPAAYVKLSAVYRTHLVTTPMPLAVGDHDIDCLLDSIEMYNGLRVAGREVTLLRYPGQGHGFSGEALHDFWQRETAFFSSYLNLPPSTPNGERH